MKQILIYVQSFVVIVLILSGISGVSYHMFKEGGWLGKILGAFWDVQTGNPVVAIPVTIAVLFIGKMWYDHNRAKGHTSRAPDVLIYIVMAAGAYFLFRLATEGSL